MEKKSDQGLTVREAKKIRDFGRYFAIGMSILTVIGIWKGFPFWVTILTAFLCVYHGTFSLINPIFLKPSYLVINAIARFLGDGLTLILFSVIYFVLITPVSFLLRLAGKDVIRASSKISQWKDIPAADNDPERIKKLY